VAQDLGRHRRVAGRGWDAGKSWELVRLPFTSSQLTLAGAGWTPHGGYQDSGLSSEGGFEEVTSHAGDTVTVTGRFVDLAMLCRRGSDCGQVSVALDGGSPVTFDLYRGNPASTSDLADAAGATMPQERVVLSRGLADAVHTAVITLLSSKNAASSGHNWRFESVELGRMRRHGYEVEANDGGLRLQSGAAAVALVGASAGSVPITFATPCTSADPVVVATAGDAAHYAFVGAITQTGFSLGAARRDGSAATENVICTWMAFG
jgi:hypothetical protein